MRYSHSKTQTVQTPTLLAKRDFIMSSEQFSTPETPRSAAYDATGFERDDQIDLHTSNLAPIEVIRARQAIAAAVELHKITIAPHEAIANVSLRLSLMRPNLDVDDLFAVHARVLKTEVVNSAVDHAVEAEFLHGPADIRPTDTQDDFGLAA